MWKQVHSFTEWLLNKYLARYLKNVNLHQVHIGLTQGSVELENLELREDALENFNLPFKIIDGKVGKLELQVPVTGISSGSLVLCLSDLHLRASPYQGTEPVDVLKYDPAKEEEEERAALALKLEYLEQQIYQHLQTQSKSWLSSFASSYFTSMIENLKLVINDVHFRYEDAVSVPAMPFAVGVTIQHLATQPSASPNKPGDCVLKEVELEGLAVYWNFGSEQEEEEKCYVLDPISAKVELTQNKSKEPLKSLQTPRFTASLTLQTFQLTLSSRQYHMTAQILNIIDWQRRVKLNRKWHPGVPVSGNARAWWQFAISAVRHPISKRLERERPSFVQSRARLLVQYVNLYVKMLAKPEIKELIREDIKPLEGGLTYEEVYLMRSLALSRVQRVSPATTPQQGYWSSWVTGWGWGYTAQPEDTASEGEEPVDYSLFFDKDSVFAKVSAKLLRGSVLLIEYESAGNHRSLVEFTFTDLAMGAEYRMKTDTTILSASLQDITLDNHSQHSALFPHVVSRSKLRRASPAVEQPVLGVYYELNPSAAALDLLLRVTTQPLDIVYNEDIIARVTNFFALDPTIDFVVEAALARLGELRSKTKHQLRSTIDKIFSGKLRDFRRWDILLNIHAPLLILPESFNNKNSAVVIVDLGQVMIDNMCGARTVSHSDTSESNFSTPPSTPNSSLPDMTSYFNEPSNIQPPDSLPPRPSRNISPSGSIDQDNLYENFSLNLSDLKVHAGMFEEMMQCDLKNERKLMDRFSLNMKLERRLLFSLDPLHPNILVSAKIPSLAFHLDVENMRCLLGVMKKVRSGEKPDRAAVFQLEEEEEEDGNPPTSIISASLQSSMNPEMLMRTHLIDVKVHIEKISTTIQHGQKLDLELHIDDVGLAYTKQPFDSELSLLLSTLTICDRTQPFQDESYMMARSFPLTDGSTQWFSAVDQEYNQPDALIMVQISEIGPDYPGTDKTVLTRNVDVRLNYFDLLPHHTTLAHLLGFFKRLSRKEDNILEEEDGGGGDGAVGLVKQGQQEDEWQYDIKMTVEHVSVGLLDPRSSRIKIGSAAMLSVSLSAGLKHHQLSDMSLSVGRVQLRELSDEKCILGLGQMESGEEDSQAHQALSLKVLKEEHTAVDVHVGALRYFHSPGFTSAVIISINSLLLLVEEQVSQISTKASEAANRVINYGIPNGREHVYFTVLIESPVVQLPRGQGSSDILVGHLGNVTIRNQYESESNSASLHQVFVNIDNIHLYSAKLDDVVGEEQLILHDTTFHLNIQQTQQCLQDKVTLDTKINAKIPQGLKVTLSKSLYDQIIETTRYAASLKGPVKRVRTSSSHCSTDSSEPMNKEQIIKGIKWDFMLPEVLILLQGDLLTQETPYLAQIKFEDFTVSWSKRQEVQDLYITLHKLYIIDMLEPPDSSAKFLFKSRHRARDTGLTTGLFVPSGSSFFTPKKSRKTSESAKMPISPYKCEEDVKALVSVHIADHIVDSEGNRVPGKCVVVDLNCVDMTVNLQTWVMLRDFMTISPSSSDKVIRGSQAVSDFLNDMSDPSRITEFELRSEDKRDTTVCVHMKEWNITLNKRQYPLAVCQIEGIALNLSVNSDLLECRGRMERVSVEDLSPRAGLYKDKFSVLGNEVLQFEFMRHLKEDRELQRTYDSFLQLHMSAVRYVHTKTFLAECLAFLDHFIVLDNSVQANRTTKLTGQYQEVLKHGHRILLDIQMSSPVVVVPVTPSSAHVLVGYPGNIEVSNSFRFATLEETLESTQESGRERNSEPCLLDCLDIKLKDMDVVSGVWDNMTIKQATSLLYEKCLLVLAVRRNLDSSFNHSSPNMCVRGSLSTTNIRVTEADLAKVKGFLSYNLSEDIGEFEISREHITHSVNVSKLDLDGTRCWLDIDIALKLDNVSIELLHRKTGHSLAKFDLTSSALAFQTYSNKHNVVKLTSRLLTVADTRPAGGSAFPLVVTHIVGFQPGSLQVEINIRNTPHKKHWSFVLNKVKVHGVMDFLTLVRVFLTSDVSSPERLLCEHISGLPPVAPAPLKKADTRDFDINISVINTELVLPETCSQADSQAVVLQLTTVVGLKQQYNTRPSLSITVEDVQMFSCTCGRPDTALSIVEVGALSAELRHDMGHSRTLRQGALLDSTQSSALDVHLESADTKLSYQDALLFYNIMESVVRQLNTAVAIAGELATPRQMIREQEYITEAQVPVAEDSSDSTVNLVGIEVRCESVSLCVIDDYGDRDIPLVSVLLAGMHLWWDLKDVSSLSNTLRVDYYNSYVSGWEPLLEPWKVDLHYASTPEITTIKIDAASTLDLNLTHSFYKLSLTTMKRLKPILTGQVKVDRKVVRKPFVPFLIRNLTGHELRFVRETKTHPLNDPNPFSAARPRSHLSEWTSVRHGEETMFTFQTSKHRHRITHALQSRSIRVTVGHWEEMSAISVDKVGSFFRDPAYSGPNYGDREKSAVRIVFDLILEEGARKCITVRSALTLKNNTSVGMEVLVENPISPVTPSQLLPLLEPCQELHIPVDKVDWCIRVRPHGLGYQYCRTIKWHTSTSMSDLMQCADQTGSSTYFMAATITRGNYPKARDYLPGHVICLETPLRICNALPVDLTYKLQPGDPSQGKGGIIKRSESVCLYDVNPAEDITCSFQIEDIPGEYKMSFLYQGSMNSRKSFVTYDEKKRRLPIHVRCEIVDKYRWQIVLYVKYIIMNLTVYPLLFGQQNVHEEAAGQYDAHESARSLHPLMFDYYNETAEKKLSIRLGKKYRKLRPHWSVGIDLSKPGGPVSVMCTQSDDRPQKVFDLSYECVVGTGLLANTTTVKIVSRFHLENHSSRILKYAQWFQVKDLAEEPGSSEWQQPTDPEPVIEAAPGSIMPFTWPRNDFDHLLSVCIPEVADCEWSGGFTINNPQSSVVSMRGSRGRKMFLQCTVVLLRSSYHVVFSDFNDLPAPYRIENHSLVSIQYGQSESTAELVTLEPGDYCTYHWDEPVLKPHSLYLKVTGGEALSVPVSGKDREFTHSSALVYENAVYLTLSETWEGGTPVVRDIPLSQTSTPGFRSIRVDERVASSGSRLVLDVPQGCQVLVKQYNPHSPSQLWKVTNSGQIVHYKTGLYLDITGKAPNPGTYASLLVKQCDPTRAATQTWTFQDSGALTCQLPGLAVSARNSLLHDGSDAVLDVCGFNKRAPEIRHHPRRPGCGAVLVKILLDGPTIVIQLVDAKEGTRDVFKKISLDKPEEEEKKFQLSVRLAGGIGLSIINHLPEELMYVSLMGLTVELEKVGGRTTFVFDLVGFQADNQCREALVPVVVFPVMGAGEHTVYLRVVREVRGDGRLVVYPEVQLLLANFSMQLDEVLLLKLIQFVETGEEVSRVTSNALPREEYRLTDRKLEYNPVLVESIILHKTQVNVSLIVAPVLEDDLKDIHTRLGIRSYLNFSDVSFVLDKYHVSNKIAAPSTIQDDILRHYKECAVGHKLKIVLNSEMTGNMGGLFNDLISGLSVGLDGDVSGMVKNVAHGMSDTASKLSSTASTVLAYVSADEKFRENRDLQRAARYQSSSASLRAGLAGLRSGIIGGLTSVPTQLVQGINNDGMTGAVTGLAKGIIGTVTKPAAGLFDFASGTTLAITQSTRSSENIGEVKRQRLPRCCSGEILSPFSEDMAKGMSTLWRLNGKASGERFISWSVVNSGTKILISNESVRLIARASNNNVLKNIPLANIGQCVSYTKHGTEKMEYFLAIDIYESPPPPGVHQRPDSSPRLSCNSDKISLKISQDIQYALDLRNEARFMVTSDRTPNR